MKHIFSSFLIILLLAACTGEMPEGYIVTQETLSAQASVMVRSEGTEPATMQINASSAWEIEIDKNSTWLKVTPNKGDGPTTVTVSAEAYNESTDRIGGFVVRSTKSGLTQPVKVTQLHAGASFSISDNTKNVSENGGTFEVYVWCNTSWNVQSNASWCKATKGNADDNSMQKVTVTVDPDPTGEARSCKLIFTDETNEQLELQVTQGMADYTLPKVDMDKLEFDAEGQQTPYFYITCNYEWSISPDHGDWYTVTPASGNGPAKVYVTVTPNTQENERKATLNIQRKGVDQTVPVVITQAGRELYFSVSPATTNIGRKGETAYLSVTSNVKWRMEISSSWLKAREYSGENNAEILIDAEANNTTSKRSATVKFTYTKQGAEREVECTFVQEPGRAADNWDNDTPSAN